MTSDESLKWRRHTSDITKKASCKLSVIRQLRPFLDTPELIKIYNTCVRSVLEYAAPLFVKLQAQQQDSIERIQRRAHKIICGDSDCNCSSFIPLNYRRLMLGMRLFRTLIKDEHHPLHYLTPVQNQFSRTFRLPIIRNTQRAKSFVVNMIQLANSGF